MEKLQIRITDEDLSAKVLRMRVLGVNITKIVNKFILNYDISNLNNAHNIK